ncbi:hypothetical protein [Burkholderia cenocepacia]|uniref:hypothetical protein n=1 Tax=Burkholderia cenocepacia TaxID=95486 RepID=UPI002230879B|nr:hypothetical protein [Burkholderia cenocepacia]MCW3609097.1 hypothetical protein [Burkholderia cenocepacia]MCW5189931.1 hypothetical protein [Burkholderia cenocepacia]
MDAQISAQRAQRLDALSAASDGRSKTAQLRDVFDSVERAIRAGVRYTAIIQDLAATGLEFTYQTFALTLKRIRRERGIVARPSQAARPEARPVVSRTEEEPHPSPAPVVATATDAGAAPDTATPVPAGRERRVIGPVGAKLPDDWLTADLTREQKRLLTPDQRRARADAVVKSLWPNPFDPPKDENPA